MAENLGTLLFDLFYFFGFFGVCWLLGKVLQSIIDLIFPERKNHAK
jgi:hypothetical protein